MSLAKRIVPCLDVTCGTVVKGINFLNLKKAGDPIELAKRTAIPMLGGLATVLVVSQMLA